MQELSLDTPSLSDALYHELSSVVRGEAYRRGDPWYAKLFPLVFSIPLTSL